MMTTKTHAFSYGSVCLALMCLLQSTAFGCQPQLCRRRRDVEGSEVVSLQLNGCSGKSPVWTRQIAYCLGLRVTKMTLKIKSWYGATYDECARKGCASYIDDRRNNAVDDCVQCWKEAAIENKEALKDFNVTEESVATCVESYIEAYLNNELPTFERENRFRSHVNLAKVRPAEYWWSVKVELPCEPKVFVYWNAYCVNSFAEEIKKGEYVLVQNNLVTKDQLSFFVEFGEKCMFEPEEINIIWDESTPAPGLPQVSSFPSEFPPKPDQRVNIYYNLEDARRLMSVDGNRVEEYKRARILSKEKSRIKRQARRSRLSLLGLQFPCVVRSFRTEHSDNKLTYQIADSASRRFLVETDVPVGNSDRDPSMNFTLDYGYEWTGCIFDSGEIHVVPNPPPNWVKAEIPEQPTKRIVCATCINNQNDFDCLDMGRTSLCASGEVCQTEVRQITRSLKLITKSCKQRHACGDISVGKSSDECRPGMPGSVCRCCCSTAMCNAGNNPCSL